MFISNNVHMTWNWIHWLDHFISFPTSPSFEILINEFRSYDFQRDEASNKFKGILVIFLF